MAEQQEAQEVQESPQASGITFDDGVEETAPVEEAQEAAEKPAESVDESSDDDDDLTDVAFDERQQKKLEAIIAKNTYKHKSQLEREQQARAELEQRLQALEQGGQQDGATNPQTGEPVIPDLPDPFDSDYEQKVQARDQALIAQAQWQARQEAMQEVQSQEVVRQAESYFSRAKDFGIDAEDLKASGQLVAGAVGDREAIFKRLLKDQAGPAITHYLANNPQHLEKMLQGDDYDAVEYLASVVKPKATASAKRRTAPPPPPPVETEKGTGARRERGPVGATYT